MKWSLFFTFILGTLVFAGCVPPLAPTPASMDTPNPASKHCIDMGNKLEIRDETGGQVGYCLFPDGSECEEWAFFREECAPGDQDNIGMPNPA
ncbi:MAG: DUF333 domain-containing protein, partial [Chloroflexi bacterium]|nr:DUF333 domain-containing protein [Chloroflexota bacterium]